MGLDIYKRRRMIMIIAMSIFFVGYVLVCIFSDPYFHPFKRGAALTACFAAFLLANFTLSYFADVLALYPFLVGVIKAMKHIFAAAYFYICLHAFVAAFLRLKDD